MMKSNKNTLALAKEEMMLAYKKCYLNLQHYLLSCLEWNKGDNEYQKDIVSIIPKIGETYQRTKELWSLSLNQDNLPEGGEK